MKLDFDRNANHVLIALLNEAEVRCVRYGMCEPRDANQLLASQYIGTCSSIHGHAQVYLESEERIAGEIFLGKLLERGMGNRFRRHLKRCAFQLVRHTPLYFRDYETLLEAALMQFLAQSPTLDEIQWSGLVKQAVATLPRDFAINVVRRELRRLGLEYDRLLVPEDVYKIRNNHKLDFKTPIAIL